MNADGERRSREARRKAVMFVPRQRWHHVALAEPLFEIVAAISEQTSGLESISQGHYPKPVRESAEAAALRRRDARTDGEARPPRGLQ
jgi:hypothetical protein